MKTPEEIKKGIVEAIEEASWVVEGGDAHDLIDACEKAHASMADALAYIQQLEAQVPRWISVEERLPEPGRYLVNVDALRSTFIKYLEGDCYLSEVLEIVDHFPTIEAKPVRHGEWRIVNVPKKWGGSTLRCSECNTGAIKRWNYCPDCGAKMDGGADE